MRIEDHRRLGDRITATLPLLGPDDPELRIEAAMLAGTHWANLALHRHGVSAEDEDIVHVSMLVVNTVRMYSIVEPEIMQDLSRIEELRPLHVRGDAPGSGAAADEAVALLEGIRCRATSGSSGGSTPCTA